MTLTITTTIDAQMVDEFDSNRPRVLSNIRAGALSHPGMTFTGVTRWIINHQPCRVLQFVSAAGVPVNYYIRLTA